MSKQARILIAILIAATVLVTGFVLFKPSSDSSENSSTQAAEASSSAPAPATTEAAPLPEETPAAETPAATPSSEEAPAAETTVAEGEVPPATEPFLGQVDNQPFDIANPRVECVAEANFTQVTASAQSDQPGKFAAFQLDGNGKILSVSLGDGSNSTGLIVESTSKQGEAQVQRFGDKTYRVYGQAMEMDYNNFGEGTLKPFSFDVTCP